MYTPCTTNRKGDFNESEARKGSTCTDYFTAPDAMGTNPQTNFVWLCGLTIYHYLPVGWTGRCAPVRPTDHSFVITATEVHHGKRDIFTKHDSIWGTDVPNDHKLWTNGQKGSLALFPWLGTGKLMLRMETFDYRFEQSVNSTRDCVDIIQTLSVDEYLDNLSFKNSNLIVTMMFIFCEQKGNERQMK